MKPILRDTRMNKTEAEYAMFLELLKRSGNIVDYKYEPLKINIAPHTFYTPDFLVICHGHFEFHEVKGFLRDDAAVKFKAAADKMPWFRFVMIRKNGKGWKTIMEV